MIPTNLPQIDEEEFEAFVKVMKTGMLTTGLGSGLGVTEFEKNNEDSKFLLPEHNSIYISDIQ